jgi:hypothetical protein
MRLPKRSGRRALVAMMTPGRAPKSHMKSERPMKVRR